MMHSVLKRTDIISSTLLLLIAASLPIGERMNTFFPNISLAFAFLGILLAIFINIKYIVAGRILFPSSKNEKLYILLCIYIFVHTFITNQFIYINEQSLLDALKAPIFMVVAYIVALELRKNKKVCFRFYLVISLALIVTSIIESEAILFGDVNRFIGAYSNPNAFAHDAISIVFPLLYFALNKKLKFVYISLSLLILIFVFLSGSRAAFLGLAVGLIYVGFVYSEKLGSKTIRNILLSALIIVFIATISGYFDYLNAMIIRYFRGTASVNSIIENERFSIWKNYIQNINEFLWFGMDMTKRDFIYWKNPHNTYISMVSYYGVFPAFLYIVICIRIIYFKPVTSADVYFKAMYLAIFIANFFLDAQTNRTQWLVVSMAVIILNNKRDRGAWYANSIV